jgi:hypothetical protein
MRIALTAGKQYAAAAKNEANGFKNFLHVVK